MGMVITTYSMYDTGMSHWCRYRYKDYVPNYVSDFTGVNNILFLFYILIRIFIYIILMRIGHIYSHPESRPSIDYSYILMSIYYSSCQYITLLINEIVLKRKVVSNLYFAHKWLLMCWVTHKVTKVFVLYFFSILRFYTLFYLKWFLINFLIAYDIPTYIYGSVKVFFLCQFCAMFIAQFNLF